MRDRAQLHTGDMVRWLITAAIVGAVFVIVINEMLSAQATLAPGEVEQVCGLCHVNWRRQATLLLIIGGLVAVANRLLGGRQLPDEGGDE